jgi:hypothetical protein
VWAVTRIRRVRVAPLTDRALWSIGNMRVLFSLTWCWRTTMSKASP